MRSRITITISEELLKLVDDTVDQTTIRNRSQAVEHLLRQSLAPTITTAVILAGGPQTHTSHPSTTPKALLPLSGQPLIHHLLTHLKHHGFTRAIIALGPKSLGIKKLCQNGSKYNLDIVYSQESKTLGTGGALAHAAPLIGNQPFLLLHSDILTNINLSDFTRFFLSQDKLASVAIKPRLGRTTYGQIQLQGNQVIGFHHPKKAPSISLINTGIYLFQPQVLSFLPKKPFFKLESTLLPYLIKQNQISGYNFQGIWYDISTDSDYQEANRRWLNS